MRREVVAGLIWLLAFLGAVPTAPAHEKGVIRLRTNPLPAGSEIELRGERLPRNAPLRLELRGTLETFPLAEVRTDSAGVVTGRFGLPAEAGPGNYALVALAADGEEVGRVELVLVPAAAADGHARHEAGPVEPHATAELMDVPVARNPAEWVAIVGLSLLSLGAGAALLRGSAGPRACGRD
ncbi:MAG: hypothetical protein HY561_00835 [Gemmatimonadetes bacterium]|nr:hypothetical protein [Gemmatimonadota bacterium]